MPTTRFEFGNIVLVPFPFTDQTATKQRPVIRQLGMLAAADQAALRQTINEVIG